MGKVTKLEKPVEKEMKPNLMDEKEMADDLSFRLAENILAGLLDRGLVSDEELILIRRENLRAFRPFLADLMQK